MMTKSDTKIIDGDKALKQGAVRPQRVALQNLDVFVHDLASDVDAHQTGKVAFDLVAQTTQCIGAALGTGSRTREATTPWRTPPGVANTQACRRAVSNIGGRLGETTRR